MHNAGLVFLGHVDDGRRAIANLLLSFMSKVIKICYSITDSLQRLTINYPTNDGRIQDNLIPIDQL